MQVKRLVFATAVVLVLGACSKQEAPALAATTPGGNVGEDVYRKACRACHELGIAGAPKLGDASDWGPRIAQGMDVLHEHSLKGFTGKKGVMPAKGGFTSLSEQEVTAAVDYMVSRAQ